MGRNEVVVDKELFIERDKAIENIIKITLEPKNFSNGSLMNQMLKEAKCNIQFLRTIMGDKDIRFLRNLIKDGSTKEAFTSITFACDSNIISFYMKNRIENCSSYMEYTQTI